MRTIHYYARPRGIDHYWTTPLELYCYLYHHKSERQRLQALANKKERVKGETFQITHKCNPEHLRIVAGQSDESLEQHIELLLNFIGVSVTRDPVQHH